MSRNQFRFCLSLVFTIFTGIFLTSVEKLRPDSNAATALICIFSGLIIWLTTSPTFFRRYVGEATAESLGAIRIVICFILLVMVLWLENITSSVLLPDEIRNPPGFMKIFAAIPGFQSFVEDRASLQFFRWLTISVLLLGMLGWRTRMIIPLGAFCYFFTGGVLRQYMDLYHTGLIPMYVIFILALTPCGDGLSLDRLRKVARGQPVIAADQPSPLYGWSRYACWVVIAIPYVEASLSKLRDGGLFWWEPANMRSNLYITALAPMQFDFSLALHLDQAPDILFALLGIIAISSELAYGLVLFSKKSRWIVPPLVAMMHIGILFFQDVLFLDLILMPLVFFDFTTVRQAIARRINSSSLDGQTKLDGNDFSFQIDTSGEIKGFFALIKENLQNFLYPLIVSISIISLLIIWFLKIEIYPWAAWRMFSYKNTSGIVQYIKVLAHYNSGLITTAHPEKSIPALYDTRYRHIINDVCLRKKKPQMQICDELFKTVGSIYNKKAQNKDKVRAYELQVWNWNYRKNPSDPKRGKLIKNYIFQVD